MTSIAKFLIALTGAGAIVANEVTRAHGWGHVDWVPVGTAIATALAVFAYPNTAKPVA
jgi:hypothetical protein